MSDVGPIRRISAQIVVKQSGRDDIELLLPDVNFPCSCLVQRDQTLYTTPLALITQLQQQIAYRIAQNITVDKTIYDILHRMHPSSSNMLVATTRLPVFDEHIYRNVLFGYRALGTFPGFSSLTPGPEFDDTVDVPASYLPSSLPSGLSEELRAKVEAAQFFFNMWQGCGVSPESHFIMIFSIDDGLANDFSWFQDQPSLEFPEIFSFLSENNATGLQTPVFQPSTSSTSSFSVSQSRASSRSTSPYPLPQEKGKTDAILQICKERIPDFDSLHSQATSIRGNRGSALAELARCFYIVEHIITSLGLDPGSMRSPLSFTHNDLAVEVTVEDVLSTFSWNSFTFGKKRTLFKEAKILAQRS